MSTAGELGRPEIAAALGANILSAQAVRSCFGRQAFFIPRYAALLDRTDRLRANPFGKGEAARIDDGAGFPTFAELLVATRLRPLHSGAMWFSAYRNEVVAQWPWDDEKPQHGKLPDHVWQKLKLIAETRQRLESAPKPTFKGVPDVIAWQRTSVLMIECKRAREDRLRVTQESWLHAALASGLSPLDLGVFEWRFRPGSDLTAAPQTAMAAR